MATLETVSQAIHLDCGEILLPEHWTPESDGTQLEFSLQVTRPSPINS